MLANNSIGTVSASSDGVRVLVSSVAGHVYDRLDCTISSSPDALSNTNWKVSGGRNCTNKTGDYLYVSNSCQFSVTRKTIPGQLYVLYLESMWDTKPANTSGYTVTVTVDSGLATASFSPEQKTNISTNVWNTFSWPIRATSSFQEVKLITRGNGRLVFRKMAFGQRTDDVDYRITTESLSATWSFDSRFAPFITHYLWAVFANGSAGLESLTPYKDVGDATAGCQSGLVIPAADYYTIGVKACNPSLCFDPVFSDGFRLQAVPPIATPITADITLVNQPSTGNAKIDSRTGTAVNVTLEWTAFRTLMPLGESPVAEFYEWTLLESKSSDPLIPWEAVLSAIDHTTRRLKVPCL